MPTTTERDTALVLLKDRYDQMTRNLMPEDLARIESDVPLAPDPTDPCDKLISARKLWCEMRELEAIVHSPGGSHGGL